MIISRSNELKRLYCFIFILLFSTLIVYGQVKTIEIDWGDNSSTMKMDSSETYLEMNIQTDSGSQLIYYHNSWIIDGKLIHWLDTEKKPQHKYKDSGTFNIIVTKKDASGGVIEKSTGSMTIPDTQSDSELRAKDDGILEPEIYSPNITNTSGNNFIVPGFKTFFTPHYSFVDAGINDHSYYVIKNIGWKFMPPWKPDGYKIQGFKVEQNCFSVPSSCMNPELVKQYDPYINKLTYNVFFAFSGTTPQAGTTLTGNGSSIKVDTYVDYFASPDIDFILPVKDVIPIDDDPSKLPSDYCIVSIPRELNPAPVTGGKLPEDITVHIKDENPNLVPETLGCIMDLVPEKLSPNIAGNRIGTIIFKEPSEFERFPSNVSNADGPEDFYSVSRWKTTPELDAKLPINYKGILKFWVQIRGFGPGEPYFPVGLIKVLDNDAPNLYVQFYDMFNSKIRNEFFISDKTIDEENSIPLESTGTDGKLFKYDVINDYKTWENEVPEGKLFEDTRIFVNIYAIENVNSISGDPILPYKHLESLHYEIKKHKGSKIIVEKTITEFDSEKIAISPLLFSKPGKYDFIITAIDKAPEDQHGVSVFNIQPNKRELSLILNVTDINQRTNIIRGR